MLHPIRTPEPPWPESTGSALGASTLPSHPVVQDLLGRALAGLRRPGAFDRSERLSLQGLDVVERAALADWLGAREVEGSIDDGHGTRFRDTPHAGLWWVTQTGSGPVGDEWLEVGQMPQALRDAASWNGHSLAPPAGAAASAALAALMAGIAQRQRRWRGGQPPSVLNLTLQPLDRHDLSELDRALGKGPVRITVQGLGTCEACSTALAKVWRVRHLDARGQCGLDLLEIGSVPPLALPSEADVDDAASDLVELLRWMARVRA